MSTAPTADRRRTNRARATRRAAPVLAAIAAGLPAPPAAAQDREAGLPPPEATEVWAPVPPVVRPGRAVSLAPPSDAIVLFDGTSLAEWRNVRDGGPAGWKVADGVVTVDKAVGDIRTRRRFGSYQLHLEWRVPPGVTGSGQGRGNSGVYLAFTEDGEIGYEVQILDSYGNETYVNGMAGSVYKQSIPLANPTRPPGEWQTYDIIWRAPAFGADGALRTPARVTVLFNGVLVQDAFELRGDTRYRGEPRYRAHGDAPIMLQAHGDPSEPISFRNIWVRPLPAADGPLPAPDRALPAADQPLPAAGRRPRTLVAVFAHPDDERIVGPLLSRYAREGHDVHLVIATDGRLGVRDHAGVPAGDSLAAVRAEEARCAARELGIRPPILVGLEDAGLASFGNLQRLREEVRRVFRELEPDAVITFGPEGGTGHPDHRLTGIIVTEVVQRGGDGVPGALYYASLPAERMASAPPARPEITPVPRELLTVAVPFEPRDFEAGRRAFACHATQYTPDEMAAINAYLAHGMDGAVHLRPWSGPPERRTDLFHP